MSKNSANKNALASATSAEPSAARSAANDLPKAFDLLADRLIRDSEGATLLGCSKATWWRRVADGTMPRPIRIGATTRWKLSEVLGAIDALSSAREQLPPANPAARSGQRNS